MPNSDRHLQVDYRPLEALIWQSGRARTEPARADQTRGMYLLEAAVEWWSKRRANP